MIHFTIAINISAAFTVHFHFTYVVSGGVCIVSAHGWLPDTEINMLIERL